MKKGCVKKKTYNNREGAGKLDIWRHWKGTRVPKLIRLLCIEDTSYIICNRLNTHFFNSIVCFIFNSIVCFILIFIPYLFVRTKKKETIEEEVTAVTSSPTSLVSSALVSDPSPTVMGPVKPREPIPLNQQLELFKWILEEKRKVKTKDLEEKKRIDEEKAILKQFICAKSVPSL
ncbi:unnamed protein product [Lactuca virosa]|uniref:Transmembrane protein n=1 Tax=Lactuca virosa TaxID=75947 RepID=A0AAU9NA39_9ASTR|nr:unnamed protein product [Lactuca virosa]